MDRLLGPGWGNRRKRIHGDTYRKQGLSLDGDGSIQLGFIVPLGLAYAVAFS